MTDTAGFGAKAVIFDLDGTLVDSMPLVLRAFAYALQPFGTELSDTELFLRLGAPPARALHELLGGPQHVPAALRRLEEYASEHATLIQPFKGAAEMLRQLNERNIPVGLWTGRDRRSTEIILREHSLATAFATIVCGDDLPTHKPHPGGLIEILHRFQVEPSSAIFVGDADVDVLAGDAHRVRTVLILHQRLVDEDVRKRAWRAVARPSDAYSLLLTLPAA